MITGHRRDRYNTHGVYIGPPGTRHSLIYRTTLKVSTTRQTRARSRGLRWESARFTKPAVLGLHRYIPSSKLVYELNSFMSDTPNNV